MIKYGKYPDAFYRVSVKAVIRDARGWVLCVTESERDFWELPGGGLDHKETVREGLARELREEIGYDGEFSYTPINVSTVYDDPNERCVMNIAFDVALADPRRVSLGSDVMQMEYRNPMEFRDASYRSGQMIYKHAVDHEFAIRFDRNEKDL